MTDLRTSKVSVATAPERPKGSPAREAMLDLKLRIGKSVLGQDRLVESMLIGLLANGNLLIESLPGLAKTRAVKTLAKHLAADLSRVQFTPDMLPPTLPAPRSTADRQRWPLPIPQGAGVRQYRAGGRDQPLAGEGAVGAAGGDGGAPGSTAARPFLSRAVHGARHPEPDRAGRHLSRCPRRSSTAS